MKLRIVALTLAIAVFATSSSFAQSDLGIKKVGVSVGYVNPENLDGTFSFGALIDHGTMAPRFGLESRIEYWNWSENLGGGDETSLHDIVLGARMKYYFETNSPNIQPFIGTGLGIHMLTAEVTSTSPSFSASASEDKLGIDLGGGLKMRASPRSDFLVEGWNSFVDGMNQFSLRAAMRWKVGR